ncbi:5-carboxymethyl-2-hydroxymuconate Delta-isomerase [Actinokineospora guangxiensis]|uniref:5-carboxymethyl-2-hydroxymuconate Delta-isomerase n=1 Tax=Actinokineospora guangxiensis TaxID=1490288 RepID=A0ABW0EWD4_9PSEU
MPQITVEYSAEIADSFDRRGFALALHPVLAEVAGTGVAGFKTRFVPLDDVVIGDGAPGVAMVHVRIGLLSGRTGETKKAVSDVAQVVLGKHLSPASAVQVSVEIVDMDSGSYTKRVVGG